jgi:hypothetical protein
MSTPEIQIGSPPLNRADAEAFLAALDPGASAFTFQVFDDNKERAKNYKKRYRKADPWRTAILHGTLAKCWSELVKFNERGCGIFITVNETDLKGRAKENVVRVRVCFIDLDGAPLPEKFHAKPHIVVESSPGKWHVYWRVKDCPLDKFEAIQKRLIKHYGSDPAVHDLPRVMRLPGFVHCKDEPYGTRLVEAHDRV